MYPDVCQDFGTKEQIIFRLSLPRNEHCLLIEELWTETQLCFFRYPFSLVYFFFILMSLNQAFVFFTSLSCVRLSVCLSPSSSHPLSFYFVHTRHHIFFISSFLPILSFYLYARVVFFFFFLFQSELFSDLSH